MRGDLRGDLLILFLIFTTTSEIFFFSFAKVSAIVEFTLEGAPFALLMLLELFACCLAEDRGEPMDEEEDKLEE